MNILMLGEAARSSVMEWLSWFRSVEYQKKGKFEGPETLAVLWSP